MTINFSPLNVTVSLSPTLEALFQSSLQTGNATLARIEQKVDAIQNQEQTMATALDTALADLTAKVAAQGTIVTSAETLMDGIPALIANAVAEGQAAGATPAQLQAITDLGTALQGQSTGLAAAIVAGTPAAQPGA